MTSCSTPRHEESSLAPYVAPTDHQHSDPLGAYICLLCVAPCEPMARAAKSVGLSYGAWFTGVSCVFGGGSACCIGASLVPHPIFDVPVMITIMSLLVLNLCGAMISIPLLIFGWIAVRIGSTMDPEPDYHDPDQMSGVLLLAYGFSQVIYTFAAIALRYELIKRSGAKPCGGSSVCGYCVTCFCPCCAMVSAVHSTNAALAQRARQDRRDEIPGYSA